MAQGLNFAANFFNCLIAIFVPPTACFSVPLQLPTQGAVYQIPISASPPHSEDHHFPKALYMTQYYAGYSARENVLYRVGKGRASVPYKKKLQRMLFVPFFSAQRRTQLIFSTHHDVCTRWFVYLFTYILSSFHFQHSFQSTPSE